MIVNPTVQELDAIIGSGKAVVIDLFGEWCSPCKMLAPIFARVAEANADRAEFVKVDIDVLPELAERYGISHIPGIVGISGGEVRHVSEGMMNDIALGDLVDRLTR